MCLSKRLSTLQCNEDEFDYDSSDNDFVIGSLQLNIAELEQRGCDLKGCKKKKKTEWFIDIVVGTHRDVVKFKLDSGAEINAIPKKQFERLSDVYPLTPINGTVTNYSGMEVPVLGITNIPCMFKKDCYNLEFAIVDLETEPVLSLDTCLDMNLIKRVNVIRQQSVFEQYPSVFQGEIGKISDFKHEIKVNRDISPVVNAPRRVPIAIKEKVKTKLDEMTDLGIIAKVTKPTPWVSSMVIVEKQDKSLRICLDPLHLNKAIKREHYQLPTIEDVSSKLAGARYFSILDAAQGFYQIELEETSTDLTTFHSPYGRYKFLRLPFGIASAPEVFHRVITEILEGLEGCFNYIDDILVWGRTKEEHDQRLHAVLQRIEQHGLKLTKRKCKESVTELKYLGVILTAEGMKPDEGKVKAILDMPEPDDKEGVRRFLGLVNQFSKFLPDLADITAPIRELLNKKIEWHWEEQHKKSFTCLKKKLVSAKVLAYFDPSKISTLSVDASKDGLGAVLMQEGRPVAFASRAMTETECRYAQIEKETLAVVFGCERFHEYLYGRKFNVESDHKPLEIIMKKSLDKAPARIQRFMLKLQKYQFSLRHVPGKQIPVADALSRAYLPYQVSSASAKADMQVHLLLSSLPVTSEKYGNLKKETADDKLMSGLKKCILNGWPDHKQVLLEELRPYWHFREELTCADGLIFKGNRIVVPVSMQHEILKKIHDGHLGIELCRRRARAVVYWPGMGQQIEEMIKKCSLCQRYSNKQQNETLMQHETPEHPWQNVATDLFQWAGKDYLLVVDRYSGYPEIALLSNTTSSVVIKHMKSIFARHGIPVEVLSDNGPQYSSGLFKKFSTEWGFIHKTSSPLYPKSNGLAERTVQTVKRILKKAYDGGEDPYLALLSYRNTATKSYSPAELLMGRSLRTRLPVKSNALDPILVDRNRAREVLEKVKEKQKSYYDRQAKDLHTLNPGERIRVRQGNIWMPGFVDSKANMPRSYNIKTHDGRIFKRNRSDLLSVPENSSVLPIENVPMEDDCPTSTRTLRAESPKLDLPKPKSVIAAPKKVHFDVAKSGPITTRSGRVIVKPRRYVQE